MKFTIIEAEQRSVDWFLARAGRLTGSKADAILAKGRGGAESTQRRDYRIQLACERLTGKPQEAGYINAEMQRGIDMEPAHLAQYEALTGDIVRRTGFLRCDDLPVGCSLDGDIDDFAGLWEGKAPKTSTHIGYLRDPATLLADYRAQITHNLWTVPQAQWLDLSSFDDRLPQPLQMVVVRVMRDQVDIAGYEKEAHRFLAEVTVEVRELTDLIKLREAA
jgi:hypothetical protein